MDYSIKICPKCGNVMAINTDLVLTSNPPQYYYTCADCGYTESDTFPPTRTGEVCEIKTIDKVQSLKKIPFELDKAKELESNSPGEFIVTNNGRKTKIISWDKKNGNGRTNIVALVETPERDTETIQVYDMKGHLIADSINKKTWDLYMLVEPDYVPGKPSHLTKDESLLYDIIKDTDTSNPDDILKTIESIQKCFLLINWLNYDNLTASNNSNSFINQNNNIEYCCAYNLDCNSCPIHNGESSSACPYKIKNCL